MPHRQQKSRARIDPYSALKVFMGVFRNDFAAVDFREELCYHSRPKKQIREAYFKRITAPKKSRAKNNTNSEKEFVLFPYGAEDEIRTRATGKGTTPLAGELYFCLSSQNIGDFYFLLHKILCFKIDLNCLLSINCL